MHKSNGDTVKDTSSLHCESISLDTSNVKDTTLHEPEKRRDGGIGWLVLLSAFSISVLVDGVCFSFGIFFDEFRAEFGTSKAGTSWIGSVLNGSYLIFGPLVSALVNVYGCRRVTMCGAVLATFGFFICTFSTNIGVLIFTYGFLGGVGFGLMYLPSIVIVGYYFEKRRALATGIACCGSGIGAFLFAPFSEYLLKEFGWRGALWIMAGLVLNGFMFGMSFKPLPGTGRTRGRNTMPTLVSSESMTFNIGEGQTKANEEEVGATSDASNMLIAELSLTETSEKEKGRKVTMTTTEQDHTLDIQNPLYRTRSVTLHGPEASKYRVDSLDKGDDILRLTRSQDMSTLTPQRRNRLVSSGPNRVTSTSPFMRKDIFYSGSLLHLKEFDQVKGSIEDFRKEMQTTSSDVSLNGDVTYSAQQSFSEAVMSLFDFSLLKSPTFLIYGMSCFLCMAGFFVPFIYMPTHVVELGYDGTDGALLISIIGITNTVGRVAVGFISDQHWVDCLLINNVALAIGGVVTIFVPFYKDYYVLGIYAAVFGSCIAVFVSLRSIIMVELMGLDRLTTAFGLVIMCQGMSSLLGAPLAGALSDATDSYDASFYMAGITLTLSGLICLPLRRVARWEQSRKKGSK